MTVTNPSSDSVVAPPSDVAVAEKRKAGRWISDWRPEDEQFWTEGGAKVAKRNLVWSIFAEHLGFSVWLIWSVSSAFLVAQGFSFTPQQLFFLVAIPNLVGALIRIPYTLAVGKFGGRNWTMISAGLLLIPTLGFAWAVTNPGTPYWAFCLIAATAGFGGGNFASSMANINFFYPARLKGAALGLNAAGGNLGVSIIQFALPVIVGGAGIFGLVKASEGGIHLERAAWVYAGLAVAAVVAAFFFMDNLEGAKTDTKSQLAVVKHRHTWVMAFLYIGTFGSFIGYSAAMPLLIKLNFWHQPSPDVVGTGINFAFYAFLGALVGSLSRPLGGYLADKYGGARVTVVAFCGLMTGTLGIVLTLGQLVPATSAAAVEANGDKFAQFLGIFVFVFFCTGIGNGSTYKMIPAIFRKDAMRDTAEGSPERELALHEGTKLSSAAVGIIGAVGAIGGFLIPISFNSPWVTEPLAATKAAFWIFTAFYVVCAAVTFAVYLKKRRTDSGYVGV
ncbi:NNP family nitrate/nitrite transporter-like MFS transporter [Nocardioides thalensis]|uniref:NNP family nitrate/nitrite transporter-like MFS transporter n=1 Tax=Nocardioides thalensis TaxID=1914755 RepID=A0A853BVP2_9ACTN|nr:MFS transporter [Nocardioides thalensis]NYI99348.1 NNP family nitrate/nitrite transporter-like MFS transporter [Nocardioides thalensis]